MKVSDFRQFYPIQYSYSAFQIIPLQQFHSQNRYHVSIWFMTPKLQDLSMRISGDGL